MSATNSPGEGDLDKCERLTQAWLIMQVASTVVFLRAGSGCGPTVILDQRPHDNALAQRGWCIPPHIGSCVTYPGNWLHGVLPGDHLSYLQTLLPKTSLLLELCSQMVTCCHHPDHAFQTDFEIGLHAFCILTSRLWLNLMPSCYWRLYLTFLTQRPAPQQWKHLHENGGEVSHTMLATAWRRPDFALPGGAGTAPSTNPYHNADKDSRTTLVIAWWGPHAQPRPSSSPLGPMRACSCVPQQTAHARPDQAAHAHVANAHPKATGEAEPSQSWGWLEDFSLSEAPSQAPCICSGPQHEQDCCCRCTEKPAAGCAAHGLQNGDSPSSSNDSSSSNSSSDGSSSRDSSAGSSSSSSSGGGILLTGRHQHSQASQVGKSAQPSVTTMAADRLKLIVPEVIDPIWEPVQHLAPAWLEHFLHPVTSDQMSPAPPEHSVPGQQHVPEKPYSAASTSPLGHSPRDSKASDRSTERAADEVRNAKHPRLEYSESACVRDSKRAKQAESFCTHKAKGLLLGQGDPLLGIDSNLLPQLRNAAPDIPCTMPGSQAPDVSNAAHSQIPAWAEKAIPATDVEAHNGAAASLKECESEMDILDSQHKGNVMGAAQPGNAAGSDVMSWLAAATLPPLRFFLRGADEIRSVYLPC